MIRLTRLLVALIAVLNLLPAASHAQEPALKGVWRFVDAQTLAVARMDLSAYDRAAVEQWLVGLLTKGAGADEAKQIARELGQVLDLPVNLRRAGARDLYAVGTLSGLHRYSPGHFVIPLGEGADPVGIARAFFTGIGANIDPAPADPKPNQPVLTSGRILALVAGDALVISTGDATYFASFPAVARPDLEKPLAAAGNATFTGVLSPTDDTRKVIEQILPQLPPPANVPSTVVTRGVRFAHVAVSLPPQLRLDLQIQSDSPQSAQELHALVIRLLDLVKADPGFRRDVPAADQVVAAVTPKLADDRLTLSLDPAATNRVFALLSDGLAAARAQARASHSMSNLKQIGMAMMLYSEEHQGAFPDSLDQIAEYLGGPAQLARININPAHPARKPAYAYLKPAMSRKDTPPTRMLAHETFDQWPGRVNVLFVDGHVEAVADPQRFQELLNQARDVDRR